MWEKFWIRVRVVPIRWLILVPAIIVGLLWLRFAPPTAPWSPRAIAGYVLPEPKVITKIEKVDVPGPVRIRTIVKEKIVEKYKDLPTSATMQDNTASVIAAADIPPSPDGGVALAVLRPGADNVGVGSIEYRPATRKFLQFKREFIGEAYYYPAGDRQLEAALSVLPVRIGPVEVKIRAGIDVMKENSAIRGFVGVGGEIHF
jgi:hypothetical protein